MNRILTLSAIAMFAVVMGLSSFAPVVMATPSTGSPTHNPKVKWCHFDRDVNDDQTIEDPPNADRQWEVLRLNKHSAEAHEAHGDIPIGDGIGEVLEANCNKAFLGDPDA